MIETEEKTEFKFEELSDSAKETARNEYRTYNQGYDWWDDGYEDAVRMAALIGIEIGTRTRLKSRKTIDISFSGFCSQGDGACFTGNYRFKPGAVKDIQAETNDAELLRIATELQALQLTRRLLGLEYFTATISTSGNYRHSGSMNVEINFDEDISEDEPDGEIENTVTKLMRDFADWIYERLEAEDEYLNSDETIDAQLSDSENLFDSDGNEI